MPDHLARFDPRTGMESLRRDLFEAGVFRGLCGGTPTTDVFIREDSELVVDAHLPEQAQEQQITATFENGVLGVSVPLTPGTSPQPIPITNGHSRN